MGLLRKIVSTVVVLIEDAVERHGDPDGDRVMGDALRKARDRAAELALENAELHDRLESMGMKFSELEDRFAFNGPSLYSDEVAALKHIAPSLSKASLGGILVEEEHREACHRLLSRSDHFPFTEDTLRQQIHDTVLGKRAVVKTDGEIREWLGDAKFDPEEVPADDDDIPF